MGAPVKRFLEGLRGHSNRDEIAAADLAVRAALTEYTSLRQEMASAYQLMAAATTLAMTAIGAVASLAATSKLGGEEAPVLLIATALVLMMSMSVVAVALHVRTIAIWLQHTANRVRAIINEATKEGVTVPSDLMGWEAYASSFPRNHSRVAVLRSLVWLQVIPVPFVALVFQVMAWADWWTGKTDQPVLTFGLLLLDLAISVAVSIFSWSSVSEARRLRREFDRLGYPVS